jgi:hypothetical protein
MPEAAAPDSGMSLRRQAEPNNKMRLFTPQKIIEILWGGYV